MKVEKATPPVTPVAPPPRKEEVVEVFERAQRLSSDRGDLAT